MDEVLLGKAGFRNIAMHNYRELDLEVVKTILRERLSDLKTFAERLVKLALPHDEK